MKKGFFLIAFCMIAAISFGQGITLLWRGGNGTWDNAANWIQINTPIGQTPISRIPTELDHVRISGTISGNSSASIFFPGSDSLTIGGIATSGSRCRSLHISNTTLYVGNDQTIYSFRLAVYTTLGGKVLIDSNTTMPRGHFLLNGGNASVKDLEILNSHFGDLFSHELWSSIFINPNGKARLINSSIEGFYIGSSSTGGELIAENCDFLINNYILGENSVGTLISSSIDNDMNNGSLNFHIGKNASFTSSNVNVTSFHTLDFYTSGSTLKGNVTLTYETTISGGFAFSQADPANPLPNIIDGNLTFLSGQGVLGIRGDVKISGDLINNAIEPLFYPDTAHVFVNGQDVFKMGGITNFRNNVFIDNCVADLCHFKFEFFGNTNSRVKWDIGFPLDTMIINKTGCGKVTVDNSLYVAGQLKVQSGQLVLNPNAGIPFKMVSAGDVIVNNGAGIFLRRNSAGVPANMAIGGTLVNNNTTSDSTCFGISNPYNGTILSYNPNVNNVTVPVCVNSGTSIVSNVSGTTYRWERNTGTGYTLITNGPNYSGATTNTLQLINIPSSWDNYLIRCVVNGSTPSHTFVLDIVSSISSSVSITSSSTSFCPFSPVTFYANPVNGGSTPVYQWQINGVNAGSNASIFTPGNLANNDQVRVLMQSSLTCASPVTTTSNVITVTVSLVIPSLTITGSASTVCSGSTVTFTPVAVNGGATPFYQWLVNGVPAASGPSFTIPSIVSTSVIKAIMTSSHPCAVPLTATSNEVTVTVSASNLSPAVSIAASATTICNNTSVVFTATPVNGGSQPSYQWQVNGVNVGGNSPTFTSSTLANGSVVRVVMTSSSSCAVPATATSNSITVTVSTGVVSSVTITASTQSVCNNAPVTFTATPANGGASPVYQWKKNGIAVGTNSATFTTSALLNADVISVAMVSSAPCASPAPITSNSISMTVNASVASGITIDGLLLVGQGGSTTINSVITNGGNSPAYQWQDSTASHAWQNISNAVNATLNYSPQSTGDKIRAMLTSSATCANPLVAVSNELGFTVARPAVATDRVATYPNPATSYLVVDSLSSVDEWTTLTIMSSGGRVYFSRNITGQNKVTVPIQSLLPGMYMIRLSRNVGYPVYKKFIKL